MKTIGVLTIYFLAITVAQYEPIATYQHSQQATIKRNTFHTRIVNGSPAYTNQFPHQVSVLAPQGGGSYSVCGGSVISPDWVLTAAHCTKPYQQFDLRFGSLNMRSGGVAMTSFHAIHHPQYNEDTLNNDVSLIRNPRSVGLSPSINMVELPRASQQSQTFVGLRSTVSGFGIAVQGGSPSTILRWVDMRIITNAICEGIYGSGTIVDHVVCALGYENPANQGHCGGDSGGPLIINENGMRLQIGVVSFAAKNGCDLGYPSGYMRTSHFVNWVYQMSNIPVRP